ncbi:MAG: TonB-dependent receptor, partial [Pseudopedobacter saltans]
MLAGRISGLIGVQRSGLPGSNSADIWIRGISTFGGSNSSSPLIIVDGVQGRGINDFDPEDIESFTILKDASATAVYGAQGANGVIIITTKKGTVGKVNLMVNYNEGITAFTKKPEMASAKDYMELRNEAMIASGLAPAYTQDYIDSTLDPTANHYVYPNVDWIDLLFNKVSSNRRLNFSARGGTENTQFYTSVSYYDESSLLKTDGLQNFNATTRFQRFNYVSNVDMKWTKTTKFYLGITGYVTNFNEPYNGAESAFSNAMGASPVLYPAVYPGNLVAGISMGGTPSPNPWADITQSGYNNTFGNKIASTLRLNQDFSFWLKGLSAEAMYSFDTYTTNTQSKRRNNSVYYLNQSQPYNQDGTLNLNQVIAKNGQLDFFSSYGQSRQYTLQGQIMYNRTFGAHNVYGMLVYNQISTPNPSADNATDAIPVRTQNYATRATYSYLNKYLFEFNGAFTGSQVFSPEHRYGFFPSWSIGWVLSNEKYWKAIDKYVQFFKLRYSNGFSGAIGGSRYDYLTTIGSANGITFGQSGTGGVNKSYSGLNYTHYGDDVRWAKSHDQDLGVEF